MTTYSLVIDGTVLQPHMSAPLPNTPSVSFGANPTDRDYAEAGWLRDVLGTFDPDSQILTVSAIDQGAGTVTWAATDLTPDQIAAVALAKLQAAAAKVAPIIAANLAQRQQASLASRVAKLENKYGSR